MSFPEESLYAGLVYDSLRQMGLQDRAFLLDPRVRPLDHDSRCFGPVFTNRGRLVRKDEDYGAADEIRVEMYRQIQPGQVVVLEAGDDYCAHAGDITSLIYSKLGVKGFVTDGLVRDSARIRKLGLPCFCRGTNPIDALDYWAITDVDCEISLPGLSGRIAVSPGDWVFGDADGVLLVPGGRVAEFNEIVERNLGREEECRRAVTGAASPAQVYGLVRKAFDEHGRW